MVLKLLKIKIVIIIRFELFLGFQAFDLDTYWIKRLYNNITKSVP